MNIYVNDLKHYKKSVNNMYDQEIWFEWERQATIHPLMICMEAWMEPTKKRYGRPWPPCLISYKKDIVCWYLKWSEFLGYGEHLIKQLIKKQEREKLLKELEEQVKEMKIVFESIENTDLEKLSEKQLLEFYNKINSVFTNWFIPGALVEPIGHKGERMLREMLEKFEDKEKVFSLLTTTTRESFSKRELKDLLKIADAKKNNGDIEQLLKEHVKKYFWLHNNYFATEVLDEKFFENEINLILEKYPNPKEQIKNMENELLQLEKKKKQLIETLKPDESHLNLIELLDLFAWYQDYRKEYTMIILYYLDLILVEIGKRKGLSLKQMKYVLPKEIPELINGDFDPSITAQRMNRYIHYFDGNEKTEQGTGDWADKKQKQILGDSKQLKEIIEVSGMIANKGFVKARARVTMSAEEAKEIQPGEILITSMTTPDFVTAIKRAAAIVTNEGGVLCHAAVVSREFGIPCIVGTKLATKVFKTGDLIEVDGELGVVRKINK